MGGTGGTTVRVRNETRDTVVAERCHVARSSRERILGLHVRPRLEAGDGLLLPGAQSIDMLFMRYAIDVVFIDGSGRVTKTITELRPWRIVPWARGARDCIELPVGAIASSQTEVGDQLRLDASGDAAR